MRRRIYSLSLSILLIASCAGRKPGEPLTPGFNVYSPEQDIELGRRMSAEVRKQVDVVENPFLQNYIDEIGRKLAATPGAAGYPYEFTLINDKSINAFALPGGPIFVNSGLVAAADNEAQVAGVVAHEIAHVKLRHATSQASKANILQLPAAIAGAVIGGGTAAGQLGQLGLGLGLNALILNYSRAAESEADALGARIMAEAGYNPVEMARFFEKLEAEGGARAPQFLSSHPNPGNRVKAVEAEIRTLPQGRYGAGTGEFGRARQLVEQLPEPSRKMADRGAAPEAEPGSNFQRLDMARFTVAYPEGWRAYGQAESSMVVLAPPQGLVNDGYGNTVLGYGAILSYYFPEGGRQALRTATAQLISRMEASNPGLEVAGNSRRARVGGAPALVTTLRGSSPYGGEETTMLVTVERPEGLFFVTFVAPRARFAQLQPAFDRLVNSIRFRG